MRIPPALRQIRIVRPAGRAYHAVMRHLLCGALGAGLVLALMSWPAAAQPVAEAQDSGAWLAAVLAVLLLLIVLIGSFMGSRRGHQD
jgi:uncharacterized membrane protein